MLITDTQVATLRAQLAGEKEEHQRLLAQLDNSDSRGYTMLVGVCFVKAVERRFASGSEGDVIEFVADVRTRSKGADDVIDPRLAEQVILAVHNDADIDDIEGHKLVELQVLLLAGLIGDERLSDSELDETLASARRQAEQWINSQT